MVQKITCPECNAEFDLAEVHKKHLKNLENKTRAEAEKSAKKEIQDNKKKAHEWAKEKIKAEQEKKDEVQKQLLAEQQKNKQAEKKYEKKYKDHFASLSDSKIKAAKQDLEEKHVGGHHSDKDEHGNTATTPGENEVAIAGTRVGLEPCLGLVKVFNPIEIEW